MTIPQIAGYLPAVIFPAGTLLQLIQLYKSKSSKGFSQTAWSLFALGNLAMFIYTEKYTDLQAISGLLLTFVLQIGIVALIIRYRKRVDS